MTYVTFYDGFLRLMDSDLLLDYTGESISCYINAGNKTVTVSPHSPEHDDYSTSRERHAKFD